MKTFLRAFLLTISIAIVTASSAFALPKILILGAEQTAWIQDIQTKLQNTGQFAEVDIQQIPSAGGSLPTLSQLQGYGSVMVFSDYGVGAGLGTILAQYADGGGGVVVCMFCLGSAIAIDASFNNTTYNVITPGNYTEGTASTIGTVSMPSHPIMNGVSSVNGGTESFRTTSTTLNGNGFVIASWNDGTIMVAARTAVGALAKARRVDINMFPVSTAQYSGGWLPSTNGDILMANAMTWAAGGGAPPSELNLQPRAVNFGTAPLGAPVTYCVTANSVGAANLHIKGISLSGPADFTLLPGGKQVGDSILAGGNAQYCIQFSPTASGTRTGTFTLSTDGRDSGIQVVTLTGNGQIPSVSYSSTSMFRGVNTELTDTSATQYLYVNSTGVAPLTVSGVSFFGIDQSAYFVTHMPKSTIAPGGVDSIGVRFVPDIEGQPDAHMVVKTNALNNPSDTVGLFGVGILPHLTISSPLPNVISNINHLMVVNFDSVKLGTDSLLSVVLTNPGSDTLAIEKNYFSSADVDFTLMHLTAPDTLIPPGGTQTIQVGFDPVQQGYRTATLRIVTSIPHTIAAGLTNPAHDTSEFDVQFIGTGVPTGQLSITGPSTNGNVIIGKSGCVTDTLWNTGAASLTVTTLAVSGTNAADFTVSGFTSGLVLGANSSTTFQVCADPSDTGAETALLTATGTSSETPVRATLALAVNGQSIADTGIVTQPFLAESCGSDTEIITVTNKGNVTASYLPNPLTGTNAGDFSITPTTAQTEVAGGVATFTVVFTGTGTGETANLIITGSEGGNPIQFPLTASSGAAVIAGTQAAPMTAVGSTSAPFTVTVNNTGTCPWTSGNPTVDPQFTYVSGAGTIAAGGSSPFVFTYTPTSEAPNTYPVTFTGSTGTASSVAVNITTATDAVQTVSSAQGYSLDQNYPNPFNGSSQVEITLPVGSVVNLSIIDVQGQVVQTLLNQHYDAGSFEVTLKSDGLASGTYYYQMTAGGVTLTRQMVVLK
jgi:Abnormal spindle-like microcephaly-assoc'd, ASPM-SPD-2-Hydin/Secretion system C-terminal sorting domain